MESLLVFLVIEMKFKGYFDVNRGSLDSGEYFYFLECIFCVYRL